MSNLTKKMWEQTAKFWQTVKPTYKPSTLEITRFNKYLLYVFKRFPQARVLILGVTPEIRKLLAKLKCDVTLIDNNPVMIKAMDQIIEKRNPREKIVLGNWLKMPFYNGSFDVIMSDHPTSSLRYNQFDNFFKELKRVLSPKGYFILDIHVNAQLKKLTLDDYIEIYRKNKKWWKNFDNHVLTQYQVIMGYPAYYNQKTYRSQWGKLDRMLRLRYERGKLSHSEYNDLGCKLGEINKYTFPPKSVYDKVINKYFRILNDSHIPDHLVYQYYVPYFCQSK